MPIKYIQEDNSYDYFAIRYIACNSTKIMYMYYISTLVFKIHYQMHFKNYQMHHVKIRIHKTNMLCSEKKINFNSFETPLITIVMFSFAF